MYTGIGQRERLTLEIDKKVANNIKQNLSRIVNDIR